IQHQCKLTHRHREQAQLPQRIDGGRLICERSKNLWEPSLLAMTAAHSASRCLVGRYREQARSHREDESLKKSHA
ncbi:hypothetical protein, partial [Pseudomonas brassicacearum]|uniref:hypothetical protein n=1 Tax=Pseudomonas brassicacearum TaxID=930166 RepID=UPI001F20C051